MTTKRFKHSEIIQDDGQTICYGIEDTQTRHIFNVIGDGIYDVSEKELIKLLNELHEENQKCKEYNAILYSNTAKNEKELLKENEQLKDSVMSWSKSYNRVYEENEGLRIKIRKLRLEKIHQNKENEELKSSDTITDLETEIMNLKEENKFLRNKVATYKKGNALLKKTLDKEWK